jgi:uncharacterized membrane protein YgcG
MITRCWGLGALALAAEAAACEPPALVPGQHVYVVPADLDFPTFTVKALADATHHDVFVVVCAAGIDGALDAGRETYTEEAIEGVAAAWKRDPRFDVREDSIVLLSLDDREVRVIAGSRWDAELGLHNERLGQLVDEYFLPLAKANDLDGLVVGLDTQIERGLADAVAEEANAKRHAEQAIVRGRWLRGGAGAALFGGGLLGAGFLAFSLRKPAQAARREFEEAVAARRQALDEADRQFADLRIGTEVRDQVVELKLKGPRTLAELARVTGLLDEIQVGLTGLRRHVDGCVSNAGNPGVFSAKPWIDARRALDEPFAFEGDQVSDRLFADQSATLQIEPQAFMAALEAKWQQARDGWQLLLDAVSASLRTARDDLPRDDLDGMRGHLATAGLPEAWLRDHPLLAEADAAWATLDAIRQRDPVAYLEELVAWIAEDDALEAMVAALLDAHQTVLASRLAALEVSMPDTRIVDPARDPAPAEADALRLDALFTRSLRAGEDAEDCLARGARASDAWLEVGRRRTEALRIVGTVAGTIEGASAGLARLHVQLSEDSARLEGMVADHGAEALAAARVEVGEVERDLAEGDAALVGARELLAAGNHLGAEDRAKEALEEHGQASRNLAELVAVLAQRTAAKDDAERLLATLESERQVRVARLSGYGRHGDGSLLAAGDQQRDALRSAWGPGPADWAVRLLALRAVLSSWNAACDGAHAAYERAEAQRRADEAAEDWRRQEQRNAINRRNVFAATRSRSSSSSYRSSSSSRGSSVRSSSSGRSGGSSFKSSGRSGGRKF